MPVRGVSCCSHRTSVTRFAAVPQWLTPHFVISFQPVFGFVRSLPSGVAREPARLCAAETFRGNVMKTNVFNTLIFSAATLVLVACNQNNPAPGTDNNATAPAATPAPGAPGAPGARGADVVVPAPAPGAPGAPGEPGTPGAPGAPAPGDTTPPAPAPAP